MSRIRNVLPKEDYKIEVILENGNSVILNMESRLHTIRFGLLENKEFFNRVTTDGNFIKWEDKVEISVSEIFQLAQK